MAIKDRDKTGLNLVHTVEMDVRWRDLDDFGHINNSVYLTYFEQARIEWWLASGEKLNGNEGPVIVTAECTFLKPVFHPSRLRIDVHAGLPGNSSYLIYYEIFLVNHSDEPVATGSTKVVWVDYQQGKSLFLPERIRRMVENKS